ncbi:MAG: phenylacetate-CoA ligase [Frankiaceae bacterium]|jgi:phenylacetate-CoA ligase|nr:phenylacetate-CoA ligase [Frankiaceae bacterium]
MFDPRAEAMSADERSALQEQRLRDLVDRLLAVDGMQGRRLRAAGVTGGADVSLADLAALPTTTKSDLWETYPFGMLAVPREDVAAVHGSSGTGGRPTLVGYTRADLDLWAEVVARSLGCAGARAGTVVHNAYGYGLFTGGVGFHLGGIRMGATVIPMSGGMTQRQLTLIEDLRPEVLTCTPSYAVTLGEAARATGTDVSSLRAGIFGAEPWSEAMRAQIESSLPVKALDVYGLSEVIGPGVATECIEAQSGLHVNEDHFIVECVDPSSGAPVADGQPGELVFTTPTKEALPLLRYRSGDIASLTRGTCACGRTLVRMSKVLGRRDDMLVVRGVNVYPSEVESVLLAREGLAPHYQLVVDRRAAATELIVCCEASDGAEQHRDAIVYGLHERLGLRADVRVLAPGTVPRQEVGKAVRVVTWTEGEPPIPGL